MEALRRQAAYVERLHVRASATDRLHTRLRLDALLQGAELVPPALPPASILLVRHLADPLPGRFAPHRRALRVNAAWEAQVRAALADHYARAARPQRGVVAGAPDAILFADEAEMLACMALALHQRRVEQQWWWRVLLRRLNVRPDLQALFCQEAATLPAALRHLAAWGQAVNVIKTLSPTETIDVLRAVARAHDVPAGLMPPARPHGVPGHEEEKASAEQAPSPRQPVRHATAPERPHPPWTAWLPAAMVPPNLPRASACLLGVGLLLHARASAVHEARFRAALHRWWEAAGEMARVEQRVPEQDATVVHAPRVQHELRFQAAGALADSPVNTIAPAALHSAETTRPASNAAGVMEMSTVHPDPISPAAASDAAGLSSSTVMTLDETSAVPDFGTTSIWAANGVVTQVGGVFYLINLMRVLNLPTCFEESWGLASQVGAWGVLELLGRALLERTGATLTADPLWRALAELDGRPHDTLPGAGFHAAGDAALPPAWGQPSAHEQAWAIDTSPLLHNIAPDLGRWLVLAVPSIRRRLQQALRLDAEDKDALARTLLLARGHLYVTLSHVDLVMRLDDISLPARRAGLDANPGWLPHFGRVVTFHFQ